MNREETARLLGAISAIDGRVVTDATVLAWQVFLSDVAYGDADRALRAHVRSDPARVTPAHIVAGVRVIARARAEARDREARRAEIAARAEVHHRRAHNHPDPRERVRALIARAAARWAAQREPAQNPLPEYHQRALDRARQMRSPAGED